MRIKGDKAVCCPLTSLLTYQYIIVISVEIKLSLRLSL